MLADWRYIRKIGVVWEKVREMGGIEESLGWEVLDIVLRGNTQGLGR
jgi:hypothetical protein